VGHYQQGSEMNAKSSSKPSKSQIKDTALHPNAMSEIEARARFERAVDIAVATKPLHKQTKKLTRCRPSKQTD